jgi:hypothetical protein
MSANEKEAHQHTHTGMIYSSSHQQQKNGSLITSEPIEKANTKRSRD